MIAHSISEPRFERKFLAGPDLAPIVSRIRELPGVFRRAYPSRSISNIYFDTEDLNDFETAIEGASERGKFRLRWYDGDEANAQFEHKWKRQLMTIKEVWRNQSVASAQPLEDLRVDHRVREHLAERRPVLRNHYSRHYYANSAGNVRITVDELLSYQPVARPRNKPISAGDQCIIEVKYGAAAEESVEDLCNRLAMRLTRSSKYRTGVLLLMSLDAL